MKKIDLIIAMLLALMLMVLASCKTKEQVQECTSVSAVQELSVKDSIGSTFQFDFDQMDVYIYDSLASESSIVNRQPTIVKHISISKGGITETKSKTNTKVVTDSISMNMEKYVTPVFTPPKYQYYIVSILLILLLLSILKTYKCPS